ncbi:MAG: metallophosphoesterase family protein [Bacteroidia bacterium]|nr:metallophosphoesterase family protein [Bacteroidia bacterium]
MLIGFISDIHEDVESLRDGLTLLERRNCDAIVCLGDIVGFTLPFQRNISGRDANRCIAMVREHCIVVVAGNHDLFAVRRLPKLSAGFDYGDDWYALDYDVRAKRSRNRVWLYEDSELPHFLSEESREYLRTLPEYHVLDLSGNKMFLSHYHYPDCSGSTIDWPKRARDMREHLLFAASHGCTLSFSGHGHPEGCVLADEKKITLLPFGAHATGDARQWIVCPCIANTSRANGVLILDTGQQEIEAIPLQSRKTNRAGFR